MTEHCNQHGVDFETTDRGPRSYVIDQWHGLEGCHQCDEEYENRLFLNRARNSNIPLRFVSKKFDDFQASNAGQKRVLKIARTYTEAFQDNLSAGRCLVFCGDVGTGKTLLASIMANTLIRSGMRVFYATASELIREIRSYWGCGGNGEGQYLKRLQQVDLLILDEIGLQVGSDDEVRRIGELLDMRYREARPTLVVSNHSMDELGKFLGVRGVDRLRDNSGQVAIFNWESHRGKSN